MPSSSAPTVHSPASHGHPHAGRVALVTGAAIGNGRAFAAQLAREGARVVLGDIIPPDETVALLRAIPGAQEPLVLDFDVTNEQATKAAFDKIKEECGRLDILINNAGIYEEEPFELMTYEAWKRVMDVNVNGLFVATRAAVPLMRLNRFGRVINISSDTVFLGTPYLAHYVTSKMAAIGFTRAIATELGKYGITVNAITIGQTATLRAPGSTPAKGNILEHVLGERAIERAETPEEIAGIVSFLASDRAGIITGQTINADAGVARH